MVEVQMVMVPVTMRGVQHKVCIWMTLEAYYNGEWSNVGTINMWWHHPQLGYTLSNHTLLHESEYNWEEHDWNGKHLWSSMTKMMLTTRGQQESMAVWKSTTMANGALWVIASDSSTMASIYKTQLYNVWTHILRHDSEMKVLQNPASYTGEQMLTWIEHVRGKGVAPWTRLPKRDRWRHTDTLWICHNSKKENCILI